MIEASAAQAGPPKGPLTQWDGYINQRCPHLFNVTLSEKYILHCCPGRICIKQKFNKTLLPYNFFQFYLVKKCCS